MEKRAMRFAGAPATATPAPPASAPAVTKAPEAGIVSKAVAGTKPAPGQVKRLLGAKNVKGKATPVSVDYCLFYFYSDDLIGKACSSCWSTSCSGRNKE
jgi:hypothetical protein